MARIVKPHVLEASGLEDLFHLNVSKLHVNPTIGT